MVEHLYLSVPFLRRLLPWREVSGVTDLPDGVGWAAALSAEGERMRMEGIGIGRLRTLHLGGGTPSLLEAELPDRVGEILTALGVGGGPAEEWGVEGDPEDLDAATLRRWCAGGVTRVVVRSWSLDEEGLRFLELDPEGAARSRTAFAEVRGGGVPNWGVELLFGLPASLAPGTRASLLAVVEGGAPQISLHELRWPGREGVLPDADRVGDEYLALTTELLAAGYEGVDPTSFALPGHGSLHFEAVSRGDPYLGLGPGAHSWVDGTRWWNRSGWRGYLSTVHAGRPPRGGFEIPGPEELRVERLMSDLGSHRGISLGALTVEGRRVVRRWREEGWARSSGEAGGKQVVLTPAGWIRMDGLVLELAGTGNPSSVDAPAPHARTCDPT